MPLQAEIDFCGETLVTRHLERSGRSVLHDKIRAATWTEDSRALDMVLRQYGKEVRRKEGQVRDRGRSLLTFGVQVVEALASEVDRIEMELREIEPGLKHLDLEADRRPPLSQKALLGLAGGAAKAQSPKVAGGGPHLFPGRRGI